MTTEDWAFLLAVLNASVALNTAIIIAWSRHGQPDIETRIEPSRVVQTLYRMDGEYMSLWERNDPLTEREKGTVRQMIIDGVNLSRRTADEQYGVKRAQWNRIRAGLVAVQVAEYRRDGGLILNTEAYLPKTWRDAVHLPSLGRPRRAG